MIDISLRAVAGAAYPLFHPEFTADATGLKLGDGVDKNEKEFRSSFPYLALPHAGLDSTPHGNFTSTVIVNHVNPPPTYNTDAPLIICHITKHMMIGASGWDVGCLQQFLIEKRFLHINDPTKYFGEYTRKALMEWQKSANQAVTGYLN